MSDAYRELEYKYKADNVSLSDFTTLMENLNPERRLDISSWDVYFTPETQSGEVEKFMRFRDSDIPELTIKRKTKSSNNWDRVEIDLPLSKELATERIVGDFVALEGYKKNFKIYKTCFIFWFDLFNVVYYIVYDENMKEKGKFIEIEIDKKKVPEIGLEEAKSMLNDIEKNTLDVLNITHKNRMRNSLFELFKK